MKVSSQWSFPAIRAFVIDIFEDRFKDRDPFLRLETALQCDVSQWVLPAYDEISRRTQPLTANEGRQLGWERFAAICNVRERLAKGDPALATNSFEHLLQFPELNPVAKRGEEWKEQDATAGEQPDSDSDGSGAIPLEEDDVEADVDDALFGIQICSINQGSGRHCDPDILTEAPDSDIPILVETADVVVTSTLEDLGVPATLPAPLQVDLSAAVNGVASKMSAILKASGVKVEQSSQQAFWAGCAKALRVEDARLQAEAAALKRAAKAKRKAERKDLIAAGLLPAKKPKGKGKGKGKKNAQTNAQNKANKEAENAEKARAAALQAGPSRSG